MVPVVRAAPEETLWAEVLDRLGSVRTGLLVVAVIALAALGVALGALLGDTGDGDRDASRVRVERLADQAGPSLPDGSVQEEPVQNAGQDVGSAKRRTKSAAQTAKSAAKSPGRTRSAAKSPPRPISRAKPESKSPGSRRRASRTQTDRTPRQAS